MVTKEEVEQLMLRYFPSCLICGSNTGYKVGMLKNKVQCRSCKASWLSNELIRGYLENMELWRPDKEGRSKFLLRKERPVSFWQSIEIVTEEEVEQLMLRYFPSCPMCGSKKGYKFSGYKDYDLYPVVQCRPCKAKWRLNIFGGGREIRTLQLQKPDKKGRSKFLVDDTMPVDFWQSIDLERERESKSIENEIEKLFKKLRKKNPKVRDEAKKSLREIGQPVVDKLSKMLSSRHDIGYRWPRGEAIWLVGEKIIEEEKREELYIQAIKEDIQTLEEGELEIVRDEAAVSLGLIEEIRQTGEAIKPLIKALREDKNQNVRIRVAQILAFIKDPRIIEPLGQAMEDDEYSESLNARVQQWAAFALAKIGNERALEILTQALKHKNSAVRLSAAEALDKIYWKPMGDTEKAHYLIAKKNFGELARLRHSPIKLIIKALKDRDEQVQWIAVEALGKMKDPVAVEPLIQALKDESDGVRKRAVDALGDIGDVRALEALTQAKEDKSWVVRRAVNGALKKIESLREEKKMSKVNCLRCRTPLLTETEVKRKIPTGLWSGTMEDLAQLNRVRGTIGVTCAVCGRSFCSACMEKYGKPHPRSGGIACLECGGHMTHFSG